MKTLITLLVLPFGLLAQISMTAPTHLVGAGIYFNEQATPNINGDFFYATQLNKSGTYSYSATDVTKINLKPIGVTTNSETGIAQYVKTLGKFDIFTTLAAGASVTGTGSVGGSFSGGYLAVTKIKGDWYLVTSGKVLKSTVGGPTQFMAGLNVAWGK